MAKLVDAQVSKTCEKSCGFESHYQHQYQKNEEYNKHYIDVDDINLYKDINKIKKLMKNNIKSGYLV